MPVTVFTDALDVGELGFTEEQGTITSATRHFKVTGLSTGTLAQKLAEAKNASGIPEYGDAYPGNPNLIARTINARILDEHNPDKAAITVEYTTIGNEDGFYRFHGSSSVVQETTTVDAGGNPITVSYGDVEIGAEAEYFKPSATLSATGIDAVSQPVAVQVAWAGYLNNDTWMGFPAGCWMCTRCDFSPHDLADSPPRYKFTFEFQLNTKGWTPTVYFRDPATGQIPSDLTFGIGYKRVVVQGYRAFGEKFPSA